ncbi:hypothetical protein QUF82_02735 [Thiotrichales bacterium HSG14]|nr:hypothetical protein [Thiotrichales bacterium HSG14]
MKSIYQLPFLLLLFFFSPFSYAVSPYLAVSVGEYLSFSEAVCLKTAKRVLFNEDFQKVKQYKGSAILFAASYKNKRQYQYKAFVKCMSDDKQVVVVVVAPSIKHIRKKAERLRRKIQQYIRTKQTPTKKPKKIQKFKSISPYLGTSIGKNLSTGTSCFSAAKTALKEDGFQKIVQYDGVATLFAAYRDRKNYRYKALVKCMPTKNLVIVVVVAKSKENVRKKAENLQRAIQRHTSINEIREEIEEKNDVKPTKLGKKQGGKSKQTQTSDAWEYTPFTQSICLKNAKSAVKKSGFHHIEMNDYSAKGINSSKYIGIIRCVTDEEFVFFWVKGKNKRVRKQLLKKLQGHF